MNTCEAAVLFIALTTFAFQFQTSYAVKCTFYGEPGNGPTQEKMTNGENYDSTQLTCSALPHLPLDSTILVTNQRNGRSIQVRVTDRIGGKTNEDTIDLTYGAFGLLADHDDGEIPCSYTILGGD